MAKVKLTTTQISPPVKLHLVRVLVENGFGGLRQSKDLVDQINESGEATCEIAPNRLQTFEKGLKKLNLSYLVE